MKMSVSKAGKTSLKCNPIFFYTKSMLRACCCTHCRLTVHVSAPGSYMQCCWDTLTLHTQKYLWSTLFRSYIL